MLRWCQTATVLWFSASIGLCQNLVLNADFESITGCEDGWSVLNLDHWTKPACGVGPGHFNACYQPPFWSTVSVPQNWGGYQNALSGVGYGVAITCATTTGNTNNYLSTELTEPLLAGEAYCVRLWASVSDSSSFLTNTLHGLFSYVPLNACSWRDTVWHDLAQVTFNTAGLDTAAWSLIEATYVASGGETWFTLGNFFDGAEIFADTIGLPMQTSIPYCALYYEDFFIGRCDASIQEGAGHASSLRIYPNPARDHLTIEYSGAGHVSGNVVELLDPMQRLVQRHVMNGPTAVIDVSRLVSGLYFIRVGGKSWARFKKVE